MNVTSAEGVPDVYGSDIRHGVEISTSERHSRTNRVAVQHYPTIIVFVPWNLTI